MKMGFELDFVSVETNCTADESDTRTVSDRDTETDTLSRALFLQRKSRCRTLERTKEDNKQID